MAHDGESYNYHPLPDAHSIRLASRNAEVGSDTWAFTFETADINNPPEYVALSYSWGDINHRVPVRCDGRTVMVPQPASELLKALARGPVPLWIGSLCINQQDVNERNEQVAIMADIYSKASLVMVWLGPDPYKDTDLIFGAFVDLVERIARLHAVGGRFNYLQKNSANLVWTLPGGPSIVSPLPS